MPLLVVNDLASLSVEHIETDMTPISVELAGADRSTWSTQFVAGVELDRHSRRIAMLGDFGEPVFHSTMKRELERA